MGESGITSIPDNDDANMARHGGPQTRQEWVRANFTQIFGTSAEELQARGVNPRRYAVDHRQEIRRFAQQQRSHGIAVPSGRPGANGGMPPDQGRWNGGGARFGLARRGGTAWIGVLLALFALRFLLVDSFAGAHAAIFWVLGIGGILLVARVILFSWLRQRRFNRRSTGRRSAGQ
jgi:hypothetical protein